MVAMGSTLFSLLSARMTWLGARHGVLSQNIANADTPGYVPRDLNEPTFDRLLSAAGNHGASIGMRQTRPGHLSPAAAPDPALRSREQRTVFETAPAGNGVVLEEQMAKMSENNINYQLTNSLYRKYVGMVRTAFGPNQ